MARKRTALKRALRIGNFGVDVDHASWVRDECSIDSR